MKNTNMRVAVSLPWTKSHGESEPGGLGKLETGVSLTPRGLHPAGADVPLTPANGLDSGHGYQDGAHPVRVALEELEQTLEIHHGSGPLGLQKGSNRPKVTGLFRTVLT